MSHTVDNVVETLNNAKAAGKGCSLLIGAGCSVEAGIPTAEGFIKEIKNRYPLAYASANPKTYPNCMAALAPGERRDLIRHFVDQAKINWAHIAIAQLMRYQFVDRILTTNFDPLASRACALVGLSPAIYDFAASQRYNASSIPDQAIFHLHGQSSGFVLLNTETEIRRLSQSLKPIFDDAGAGRVWIVVGYSGENDPVFKQLARVRDFEYRLYWITYKNNRPPKHVMNNFVCDSKHAYLVQGYDADEFFITLAQRLECFPPDLIGKPFSYLEKIIDDLSPFRPPLGEKFGGDHINQNEVEIAQFQISDAIIRYETDAGVAAVARPEPTPASKAVAQARVDLMAGKATVAIQRLKKYSRVADPLVRQVLANAHFQEGSTAYETAETEEPRQAKRYLLKAEQSFRAVLQIVSDSHEALNNLGATLKALATLEQGDESDRLFASANDCYKRALEIKRDKYEAYFNWGSSLADQGGRKFGKQANQLFEKAVNKFEAAIKLKSDYVGAHNNLAAVLREQARLSSAEDAKKILCESVERVKHAAEIRPPDHIVLNNWACSLGDWAAHEVGDRANNLYDQAASKFQSALNLKPDFAEAMNNWAVNLIAQGERKDPQAARKLFAKAEDKLRKALELKPEYYEALTHRGNLLTKWGIISAGATRENLLKQAKRNFKKAHDISPASSSILANWSVAIIEQAKTRNKKRANALLVEAISLLGEAKTLDKNNPAVYTNWGHALIDRAKLARGSRRNELLERAVDRFVTAEELEPGRGAYNLACAYAQLGNERECRDWFKRALKGRYMPSKQLVEQDPDLEPVRQHEWFLNLLAKL